MITPGAPTAANSRMYGQMSVVTAGRFQVTSESAPNANRLAAVSARGDDPRAMNPSTTPATIAPIAWIPRSRPTSASDPSKRAEREQHEEHEEHALGDAGDEDDGVRTAQARDAQGGEKSHGARIRRRGGGRVRCSGPSTAPPPRGASR